jgi:hypothetical protein
MTIAEMDDAERLVFLTVVREWDLTYEEWSDPWWERRIRRSIRYSTMLLNRRVRTLLTAMRR